MGMATKESEKVKSAARAKLKKIQQSPGYNSFFNESAVEAFGSVETTAFAGKSLRGTAQAAETRVSHLSEPYEPPQ
jgi:hypothetical protein